MNVEGNNGGNDLEISRWQLFDKKGNSIDIPSLDDLGVKISSANQILTLENQESSSLHYMVCDLQGRVLSKGILSDSQSIAVQQGVYVVAIESVDGKTLSQKIVVK